MTADPLFAGFACKSLRLANRVAMASMARWSTPGGDPTPLASFYRRRIEGGAALILTEGTVIDRPAAANDPNSPRFHGEDALAGWRTVVAEVHAAGGAIVPQLWHCGAVRKGGGDWTPPSPPESPSGMAVPGQPYGRTMSEADVEDVISAYAKAAAMAKRLGFDGVEIHAGHGYLLDQFLWARTNHRADAWGGRSLIERSRVLVEVLRQVRAAVGQEFAVLLRLSQWKSADLDARLVETPAELEAWLGLLAEAGADILSASQLRYDEPAFAGSGLNLAGWARRLTGLPTITAGGVGMSGDFIRTFGGETARPEPLDDIRRRLDRGEFDLVAVGRALLADPDWTAKARAGRGDIPDCPPARLYPGLD